MSLNEHTESVAELWKAIPYVTQIEIDLAVDKGNKAEAINRCMCSGIAINLRTAMKLIEQRAVELRKKI